MSQLMDSATERSKGEVEARFSFNGDGFEGRTVAAYETIKWKDTIIRTCHDIGDANQTIRFPAIETKASTTRKRPNHH